MKQVSMIQTILKRAEKMKLDLEEITFKNLIRFYAEEIRGIHTGTYSSQNLPLNARRKMVQLGIILRPTHNRTYVSPKALELLEAP